MGYKQYEVVIPIKNSSNENIDFLVRYEYREGHEGMIYLPNGEPGYPPELPSITINSIKLFSEGETELIDFLSEVYYEIFEEKLFNFHD